VLSQDDVPCAELSSDGRIKDDLGLRLHAHHVDLSPGSLSSLERLISTHQLFLAVERFNDDTDEELHEEHANNDDQDHHVRDHDPVVALNGLLVGANGVNRAPHNVNPALGRLNGDQGEQT